MKLHRRQLGELIRIYQDLEQTLQGLRSRALPNETRLRTINLRKLIIQLARSKRRLERKIGNTILLEKQHLKDRLRVLTSGLRTRRE